MASDVEAVFKVVRVSSPDARTRGRELGEAARDRIHESKVSYEETFAHYTQLSWDKVTDLALEFAEPIKAYDEAILEEIEGIAEGGGLELGDLLAINARSEIMYGLRVTPPPECTAFYVGPTATADGHVLLGQNWDWRPRAKDTIILVEIDQGPDRPAVAFLPEAGLIGKTGFNECGVGVTLNALMSSIDTGERGVPIHVILRAILNSRTSGEALSAIVRARRGASATYTIGAADGAAVCVEAGPGGAESVFLIHPENDLLSHSNHFVSSTPFKDMVKDEWPDTLARRERMGSLLEGQAGAITTETMESILADDEGSPNAICRFPDPGDHPIDQNGTVASIVMDLTARTCEIAAGPPSEHSYSNFAPSFSAADQAIA
jgi:isopenicillin-N N-acyltransferase-like protein